MGVQDGIVFICDLLLTLVLVLICNLLLALCIADYTLVMHRVCRELVGGYVPGCMCTLRVCTAVLLHALDRFHLVSWSKA